MENATTELVVGGLLFFGGCLVMLVVYAMYAWDKLRQMRANSRKPTLAPGPRWTSELGFADQPTTLRQ